MLAGLGEGQELVTPCLAIIFCRLTGSLWDLGFIFKRTGEVKAEEEAKTLSAGLTVILFTFLSSKDLLNKS